MTCSTKAWLIKETLISDSHEIPRYTPNMKQQNAQKLCHSHQRPPQFLFTLDRDGWPLHLQPPFVIHSVCQCHIRATSSTKGLGGDEHRFQWKKTTHQPRALTDSTAWEPYILQSGPSLRGCKTLRVRRKKQRRTEPCGCGKHWRQWG